jgi:large subunit ribosomal protein L19
MHSAPKIHAIEAAFKRQLPSFRTGDQVRVHYRIREGEKERVQVFQGVVIRKHRGGAGSTFTVRKMSFGVGVERIFPEHSPRIERLEIVQRGHVRRSRLYYLRELEGKAARLRQARGGEGEEETLEGAAAPGAAPAEGGA